VLHLFALVRCVWNQSITLADVLRRSVSDVTNGMTTGHDRYLNDRVAEDPVGYGMTSLVMGGCGEISCLPRRFTDHRIDASA
jgi:hypothetical protein